MSAIRSYPWGPNLKKAWLMLKGTLSEFGEDKVGRLLRGK
jgi:hypothetical protein